ncbi:MAG TPA: Tat pathway signal sequence domain protein [Opitutaceae bacterium]|nr:Tat pathway signal sequence domain protein [Opitutaceae bacterium]
MKTHRPFLLTAILGCLALAPAALLAQSASANWLEANAPATAVGVSFGVPWARGALKAGQSLAVSTADGRKLPAQTWPLAYWPDGSIKWTGVATIAGAEGPFTVAAGQVPTDGPAVRVTQAADAVEVDTGKVKARILTQGPVLIDSLAIDGREVARHGELDCIVQTAPEDPDYMTAAPREKYVGNVRKVTVEQSGPVRAVVKIEGVHRAVQGDREWLPFIVRLYFYAGQAPVRMVHTIIYNGDKEKEFVRGLGLAFEVPFREEVQNRHVRFSNSNGGLWAEPVLLPAGGFGGGRGGPGGPAVNQLDGQKMGPTTSELAQWDTFKLTQLSAEGFTIAKRTNPKSSWVAAAEGGRASGLVFVGDVSGGLAVSVKNFWQSYPSALEVQGAAGKAAQLYVWFWSPDGPAMDMRHYDVRGHGPVNGGSGSYEDYEPGYSEPTGVARTSEVTLFPTPNVPTRAESVQQAQVGAVPPLLTVSPSYLHSVGAFGLWSLQDRSTPFKKDIEDRLDAGISYYEKSIDEHHWYGFWNFGDVRHAYDAQRHVWRYDVGGYAWDNSELGSVLWLWYSYVRTGRADIFRMAEAMTRHTSEVDTAHLGRFAGLGSRHNVMHWGDSSKEPRISQATHNRFYYYLTTDERVGDIIKEVVNVDEVTARVDMMRKAQPISAEEKKYPGRVRVGPDWLVFIGNWMVEWERTGDTKWRDKILAGVNSMAQMPYWMRSGRNLVMGYDPATGKLYQTNPELGSYNLPTIQGGAEVAFELTDLLNNPTWTKMWLQYCRLGAAPADVILRDKETGTEGADGSLVGEQGGSNSQGTPRLSAYAYYRTKDAAYAPRAIRAISNIRTYATHKVEGPESLNPVDEVIGASTNDAAQSSLMAIEILELCKDQLPANPLPPEEPGRGGRGAGRGPAAPAPAQANPTAK